MRYRITINTDKYRKRRCSRTNWEGGTQNNYMEAINGRTFCESSLREVSWLLDLFQGISHNHAEWTPENSDKVGKYGEYYGMSDRFYKWLHKRAHTVTYHDKLCGFDRTQWLSGYGWMQGYFSKDKVFEALKETGTAIIPFSWLYDMRQYDRHMNGCYMKIEKVA